MSELGDLLVRGASDALKETIKDLVKSATKFGQKEYRKLLIDFQLGFGAFLERNFKRNSKIKTLLNPNTPVSLEATYIVPNLNYDDQNISGAQFVERLSDNRFFVITGIGGSGKSVFLKHLFICFYKQNLGRIPFFVELRNIKSGATLIEHMFSQLSVVSEAIDKELFRYALKSGKFVLLLDGFDEVESSLRDNLASQILELSYEFSDNAIVLTSRPDSAFDSWHEFVIAKMEPFNKRQVLSLISKMRYDKTTKREFAKLVKESIFETHANYLSNPLLATLMLLTYDQGAEIPTRMHVFFERAFDVLFYKHDATKQASFRRKFKTSLAIDEFRALFATFSTFTYVDHGSSFTHKQAIQCANAAIEYDGKDESAASLLADLCTSVSILVREGESYNYIHRSMQEFFVAQFLAHRELEDWDGLVERLLKERANDSVVSQLADINSDKFERQFLAPRISEARHDLENIDPRKNPERVFSLFYITFSFRKADVSSWTIGRGNVHPKWYYLTRFLDEARIFGRDMFRFDWAEHFARVPVKLTSEPGGSFQVMEISDAALLGTPMVDYLSLLKANLIALDDELRSTLERQNKLFSSALLKKRTE